MNEAFKNSMNLIPNGVLLIDDNTEKITFANKSMLGINHEDESSLESLQDKILYLLISQFFILDTPTAAASVADLNEVQK